MNKKLFVPLLLVALSLSACSTTVVDTTATIPPVSTAPILADVPMGCPSKTTLTVKTSSTPTTSFDATSQILLVAKANPEKAMLAFGDSVFGVDNMYSGLGDGKFKVTFSLVNKDKQPINTALFTQVDTDNGKVSELGLSTKESLFGFIGKAATVDLKVVSHTYACGTINFDDGYASVKGDFIAQVNTK